MAVPAATALATISVNAELSSVSARQSASAPVERTAHFVRSSARQRLSVRSHPAKQIAPEAPMRFWRSESTVSSIRVYVSARAISCTSDLSSPQWCSLRVRSAGVRRSASASAAAPLAPAHTCARAKSHAPVASAEEATMAA
eukprot:6187436-Pleurochrysis_carterae.AAC.6